MVPHNTWYTGTLVSSVLCPIARAPTRPGGMRGAVTLNKNYTKRKTTTNKIEINFFKRVVFLIKTLTLNYLFDFLLRYCISINLKINNLVYNCYSIVYCCYSIYINVTVHQPHWITPVLSPT